MAEILKEILYSTGLLSVFLLLGVFFESKGKDFW